MCQRTMLHVTVSVRFSLETKPKKLEFVWCSLEEEKKTKLEGGIPKIEFETS